MSDEQQGPQYVDPPTKAWAEEAEKDDYVAPTVKAKPEDQELSDDGFINVGAEYRNFANETDKPLVGDDGPEAQIEERHLKDDYDETKGATPEGVAESDDGEPDDDETVQTPNAGGGSGTPAAPPFPPSGQQPS